jgi:arylsulfatase A
MMKTTTISTSLLSVLCLCWFANGEASAADRPPNIVYIMADDLGYAELGCYGQEKIQTPNIDALATQGTRFTQVYAGCNVCAPCRGVLLTGYHGGHAPVRGNSGGIPMRDADVTIAEVLNQAGYVCGGFGKWGLGDFDTAGVAYNQGFDEFVGYYDQVHAHSYYPMYIWDTREKLFLAGNSGRDRDGLTGAKRGTYSSDVIMERAQAFIRKHKERPFFCYIPSTVPHTELLVPEDSLSQYAGKWPEPNPYITESKHYQDQPQPRAAFAAMITRLDKEVGRVLSLLDELGLADNTVVFFTSDNGGQGAKGLPDAKFFAANHPLRGHKGSMYEGGLRVPMIVRWPDRVEAGAVDDHPWYFADVMPTLAELAGAGEHLPADVDGISVLPTLLGTGGQQTHRYMYWETAGYDPQGKIRPQSLTQAVRMGDWKGIRKGPGARMELYQLDRDVSETTDVAASHAKVVAQIGALMAEAHRDPPPQREPEPDGIHGWRFR